MEREILIANTKTQKRSKINSTATTLAELKSELTAAGIDYSGMTFTEGISKTQLISDDTQLPSNVMYKGQPTNNLVILLTNTKKNIASGAGDRATVYIAVTSNNLQEAVKAHFGRNFTQVSTDKLIEFLRENDTKLYAVEEPAQTSVDEDEDEDYDDDPEEDAIYTVADVLTNREVLTVEDSVFYHIAMLANENVLKASNIHSLVEDLKDLLDIMKNEVKAKSEPVSTSDGNINDDDIDDMIDNIL